MPSVLVKQQLPQNDLSGPIELLLQRLNQEERVVLKQLRSILNAFVQEFNAGSVQLGVNTAGPAPVTGPSLSWGSGAPTAVAVSGSIYLRIDGGAGTSLYVNEAGAWVGK